MTNPWRTCWCRIVLVLGMTSVAVDTGTLAGAVTTEHAKDFDFLLGEWHVTNQRLAKRLADSHEWIEFEASDSFHALPGRLGIEENYHTEYWPRFDAIGLHMYDPAKERWNLYWGDSRNTPGLIEPRATGSFHDGVGTFYAPDTFDGKPITVRILWSHDDEAHAHWEQAFSKDGGNSWETNWKMDFTRVTKR